VCVLLLFDGEIKIYNVVIVKSCDTSLAKATPLCCLKIVPNANRTRIVVVSETLMQLWNAKWLQLRYDSDSTAIRPMFDYHSTAIRRFFFDRATTMRRPIRYDHMALQNIRRIFRIGVVARLLEDLLPVHARLRRVIMIKDPTLSTLLSAV